MQRKGANTFRLLSTQLCSLCEYLPRGRPVMNFESLANELLLDLFEYGNSVQLFRAFYGLNMRLDTLLLEHLRRHGFDFQSASKTDFDTICENHLPRLTPRIAALSLSDDDETPQQLTCFLSCNLTFRHFTELKLLALRHVRSKETMNSIMRELRHLSHLTHLNIIDCCFRASYFQTIWLHPKLARFKLQKISQIDLLLNAGSTSIRNLTIHGTFNQLTSLEHLIKCTPHLRCLSVSSVLNDEATHLSFIAPSITFFNLSYISSFDIVDDLLQRLPNLRQLIIRTKYIQFDGYRWETIITDFLFKLKLFQLMIEFDTNSNTDSEKQVDELLDSFRTPFWLVERQWFVRCHWDPLHKNKNYCLYTLPCAFEQYIRYVTTPFKSTSPNSIINSLSAPLLNVRHLDLTFPCSEPFWLVASQLPRLTSLSIQIVDDSSVQSQLQCLLDRAPHLYSLRLYSQQCAPFTLLAELTSRSIRRLDLRSIYLYVNEDTCAKLYNTPLAIQCEMLLIQVETRTDILDLLRNMKNLRALYVHCKDCVQQSSSQVYPSIVADDLIKWLQQRLPATFAIATDEYFSACVRLWIRY